MYSLHCYSLYSSIQVFIIVCLCGYCRYIKLLKEDNKLRLKLGDNGRRNVRNYTITNVVCEMVDWYRLGIRNRGRRSALHKIGLILPLLLSIPFAIVALFCYDMVVCIYLFRYTICTDI